MKRIRHTAEQIIYRLKTMMAVAQGKTVADVCRAIKHPADLPPQEAPVRRHAGRGGQTVDPTGEGERSSLAEGFSAD